MRVLVVATLCLTLSACSWSWVPLPNSSEVCPRGTDSVSRQCR